MSMTQVIMNTNDNARRNATDIIDLMEAIISDLKTDKMYDSYRTITPVEVGALVSTITQYNEQVSFLKGLLHEEE